MRAVLNVSLRPELRRFLVIALVKKRIEGFQDDFFVLFGRSHARIPFSVQPHSRTTVFTCGAYGTRVSRVGITLLKHYPSTQIPWRHTMLGCRPSSGSAEGYSRVSQIVPFRPLFLALRRLRRRPCGLRRARRAVGRASERGCSSTRRWWRPCASRRSAAGQDGLRDPRWPRCTSSVLTARRCRQASG